MTCNVKEREGGSGERERGGGGGEREDERMRERRGEREVGGTRVNAQ